MLNNDDVAGRLDQLLRESAALREKSEALAQEAERLRAAIEGNGAAEKERRKKPRLRGK